MQYSRCTITHNDTTTNPSGVPVTYDVGDVVMSGFQEHTSHMRLDISRHPTLHSALLSDLTTARTTAQPPPPIIIACENLIPTYIASPAHLAGAAVTCGERRAAGLPPLDYSALLYENGVAIPTTPGGTVYNHRMTTLACPKATANVTSFEFDKNSKMYTTTLHLQVSHAGYY